MFLGWRRQRWEFYGAVCVTVANGLLPRKDRHSWQTSDFTALVKPPPKWRKRAKSGFNVLKIVFCGNGNQASSDHPPAPETVEPSSGEPGASESILVTT